MIHKYNPENAKMNLDGGMDEINRVVTRLVDEMQEELQAVSLDTDDELLSQIWDKFQIILSEEIGIMDYNNQMG